MSSRQELALDDLEIFAAAVAHELRTPLAALSGEVDLALRRDRSPAAYRDALARIAAAVTELVDLTGDLTFLGQPGDAEVLAATTARLDRILARLVERCTSNAETRFAVEPIAAAVTVAGDEALLTRALTLIVEHAVKHRRGGARILLRPASPEDPPSAPGRIDLVVEAAGGAFWPETWQCLGATPQDGEASPRLTAAPLRLRTADRIIRRCGGSLQAADGAGAVHIRLRCAESV